MKATCCILGVALAVVGAASADVRLFVTGSSNPYGLDTIGNAFLPTWGDGHDASHFTVSNFPPVAAPSGTPADPVVLQSPGVEFAYVWLQFNNETKGARINGLQVTIREAGTTTPAAEVYPNYYIQNDSLGSGHRRWDGTGTPPNYPEWHNNPQTMTAVAGSDGIENGAAAWNMVLQQSSTTSVALLGAVRVDAIGAGTIYEAAITEISYATPPNPATHNAVFTFFPEPASVLLLGLAGALLRRR
jgi:hypothetical protein